MSVSYNIDGFLKKNIVSFSITIHNGAHFEQMQCYVMMANVPPAEFFDEIAHRCRNGGSEAVDFV